MTDSRSDSTDGSNARNGATIDRRRLLAAVGGSVTAGLAGCSELVSEQGITSASATPVVLHPTGQALFGLETVDVEEVTRDVSVGGVGEVAVTSYLAVHGHDAEDDAPAMRFGVSEPGAHALGILSMPSPAALDRPLNPLAEAPLGELLVGEGGRQLLRRSGVVDAPEFEWASAPERVATREVELFGSATTAEAYLGVAAGEGTSRTVLATLARVQRENDVVLVGEFNWRQTPAEPLEADAECRDDNCQLSTTALSGFLDRFVNVDPYVMTCEGFAGATGGNVVDVCDPPGVDTDIPPLPKFGITNVRIVQQVEKTAVLGTGNPTRVYHQEPDPDLVRGEDSAVVFEFDTLENLDQMSAPLTVEIYSGGGGTNSRYQREGSIVFEKSDLEAIEKHLGNFNKGEHTISVLHRLSNDNTANNGNPVFELETGEAKTSPKLGPSWISSGVSHTVSVPPKKIRDLATLKVGFVAVRDAPPAFNKGPGDRYGTNNGTPRVPLRTFRIATEYLQRVYPGNVATYYHRAQTFPGDATKLGGGIRKEMHQAKKTLDNIATGGALTNSNFPSGGIVRPGDRRQSAVANEMANNGFDAAVAIVPGVAVNNSSASDYYSYHGKPASYAGLAFGPNAAVSIQGAVPGGSGQGISSTVAQEVGHFFQDNYLGPKPDHPMAQRRKTPAPFQKKVNGRQLDKSHARHRDSSNDGISGTDKPGVASVGYDLEDGFTNLQYYTNTPGTFDVDGPGTHKTPENRIQRVPSYMSYTGKNARVWADSRVHQQLIETGLGKRWDSGLSGRRASAYVVTATGRVDEDGAVRYDDVRALASYEAYVDDEDNPVLVELLGPGEGVLASARVPAKVYSSHAHADATAPEQPTFLLPFEPGAVQVRTTYRGTTSFMNPVVRSVRDAVRRVPERGFAGEPGAARERIGAALDEVAAAMGAGAYGEAAAAMDGPVRERVGESVVEYEATLTQRTPAAMQDLLDRMVERLEAAAETGG